MKKIAVLTGAGISAESGIQTFRDSGGLWENYDIMTVASPQGWKENPDVVLEFYNARRAQLKTVKPNEAHYYLSVLEDKYEVVIITQNVDDLHERAGSTHVLHLHGELTKVRSEKNESLIYNWEGDLKWGDKSEDGAQLRPHIVWFGEAVPMMEKAITEVMNADILLIIGTSMAVYPAASLVNYLNPQNPIYLIDPDDTIQVPNLPNIHVIHKTATEGIRDLPF